MFAAHHKKSFCSCVLRSLLIEPIWEPLVWKKKLLFGKRYGKSLEFWIQKSVRTLDDLSNSDQGFTPHPSVPLWLMMLFVYSVHLARRVLQLERANTSLRDDMEREKKKKDLLGKEVMTTNTHTDWRLLLAWVCKGSLQMQFLSPERSNSWKINMSVFASCREIEFKAHISVKKYCMPEK